MKTKLSLIAAIALALCGCTSTPKIIKALGADKSSFRMRVTSIYGNVDILRANPGPGQSATVTQEGVMKIDWVGSTNVTSNKSAPVVRSLPPEYTQPIDPLAVPLLNNSAP